MLLVNGVFMAVRTPRVSTSGLKTLTQFQNLLVVGMVFVALLCLPGVALGEHPVWHKYSKSYEIHLGVVTADTADSDRELRKMHKAAPHGQAKPTNATRHIMVAIFSRADKSRVLNADVTAEVVENDLIHVRRTEKALELRQLSSGTTYCNFFDLHWNGKYRVDVRIREPGKNLEQVTFLQEETSL